MQNVAYKCSFSGSWTAQILVGIHKQPLLWAFLCRCVHSHDLYSCSSCLLQNRQRQEHQHPQQFQVWATSRYNQPNVGSHHLLLLGRLHSIKAKSMSLHTRKAESPILQSLWHQGLLQQWSFLCPRSLIAKTKSNSPRFVQHSHLTLSLYTSVHKTLNKKRKVVGTWHVQSLNWSS